MSRLNEIFKSWFGKKHNTTELKKAEDVLMGFERDNSISDTQHEILLRVLLRLCSICNGNLYDLAVSFRRNQVRFKPVDPSMHYYYIQTVYTLLQTELSNTGLALFFSNSSQSLQSFMLGDDISKMEYIYLIIPPDTDEDVLLGLLRMKGI